MDRGRTYALLVSIAVWFGVGLAGVALFAHAGTQTSRRLTVQSVDGSQVNGTVVAFDAMSGPEQTVFEQAVASDGGSAPIPRSVDTDVWVRAQYVSYENRTYRVAVAVTGGS